MAENGSTKHSRLVIYLSQCCLRVVRAILKEHINNNCDQYQPEQRVDAFLYGKQMVFFPNGSPQNQQERLFYGILYPGYGRSSNIDDWDIQLLAFVLQKTLTPRSDTFSKDLTELKRIRNAVCHSGSATLTDLQYEFYMSRARVILQRSLNHIIDLNTVNELRRQVDAVDVETTQTLYEESLRELTNWYRYDKLGIEKKLDLLLDGNQVIVEKLDKLLAQRDERSINLPDQEIVINVTADSPEKRNAVTNALVSLLDKKLRNDETLKTIMSEDGYRRIKHAVEETVRELELDGKYISNVMHGCVILLIRCRTYADLKKIWFTSMTEELRFQFEKIEQALQTSFPDVHMDVFITEKDWLRCISEIAYAIEENEESNEGVGDLFSLIKTARSSTTIRGDSESTELHLIVTPKSAEHVDHIKKVCNQGKLDERLETVSKELTKAFHAHSLEMKVVKNSPDANEQGTYQEEDLDYEQIIEIGEEMRSPYSLLQHQLSSDCQSKPQDESSGAIDIFTGEIRFVGGKVITWTCEKLPYTETYTCFCRDPQTGQYSKTTASTETRAVEKATMEIFQELCDAGQINGLTGPITIKSSKDGSYQSGIQPVEEKHDPTTDVIKN